MRYLLPYLFLFLILPCKAQVYVTPTGSGLMDGTSWANAYSAHQFRTALSNAISGTQFWLKAGTYKPHTYRDSSFNVPKGVKLYGGFNGTETALSQRNFNTNITILSGDIGIANTINDNCYHVVRIINADTSTTVDGFQISYGNADGFSLLGLGGGMLVHNNFSFHHESSPRIRNCTFSNNTALGGGGLCLITSSSDVTFKPLIENCTFENNQANGNGHQIFSHGGGGMLSYCATTFKGSYAPTIRNCIYKNNQAVTNGGSLLLYATDAGATDIYSNCTFESNTAESGGGVYIESLSANYMFDGCTFLNNKTTIKHGGGVGTLVSGANRLFFNKCIFEKNYSERYGTAIYHFPRSAGLSYLDFYNCIFRENDGNTWWRDAIMVTATHSTDTTTIYNCLFYNNYSALSAGSTDQSVTKVNFINNTVYEDWNHFTAAGLLLTAGTTPQSGSTISLDIRNSIIWYPVAQQAILADPPTLLNIDHSIINDLPAGTGYINSYPEFEDTSAYNFRLKSFSPGLNTGDNSVITKFPQTDLDALPRIFSSTVDIGAYETQKIKTIDVQDIKTNSVSLFPNPANEYIRLDNIEYATTINIYDVSGKLFKTAFVSKPNHLISLRDLPNGHYFIKLNSQEKIAVIPLIIQH